MTAVANHLWQSTLVAVVAWLLSLTLKNQRAQSRYALWLAASFKFLIPFALLAEAGTWIPRHTAPPFSTPLLHESPAAAPTTDYLLPLILLVWGCGVAFMAATSFLRWRRVAKFARLAQPASIACSGVRVLSTPSKLGPGVFGIFRPVLLLPSGILERLTPHELDSVIDHELCHVRRRDNLAAAVHMLVETVFWFHPLVWWIERQLVKERERACDEEVLRSGNDPEIYAEAILKTCRFYMESPLTCAAGVTGSNLSRRIEQIMAREVARNLDFGRKLLLALAGLAAIAAPIVIGMFNIPRLRAQPAENPAFEAASVKESKPGDPRQMGALQFLPGGRFVARGFPLYMVIAAAYDLPFQSDRITGGPEWIRTTVYDIEATGVIPPGGSVRERNARKCAACCKPCSPSASKWSSAANRRNARCTQL